MQGEIVAYRDASELTRRFALAPSAPNSISMVELSPPSMGDSCALESGL
jgi:hypothetical protein